MERIFSVSPGRRKFHLNLGFRFSQSHFTISFTRCEGFPSTIFGCSILQTFPSINFAPKSFEGRLVGLHKVFSTDYFCVREVVVVGGVSGRRRVLQSLDRGKCLFLFTIFNFSNLEMFSITDFVFKSCWG